MKKRGQSEIIAIVLIIVLVLVAIALLWSPIQNLIKGNVQNDDKVKCLKVQLSISNPKITSIAPGTSLVSATITRDDGESSIAISEIAVYTGTGSTMTLATDLSSTGDLAPLAAKTIGPGTVTHVGATKIKIVPKIGSTLCTNAVEANLVAV